MAILEVSNLKKIYTTRFGGNQVQALKNINFSVEEGEYVAIMGESGSGKTTLLNILAALDKPTAGEVLLNGKNLVSLKEKEISAFRREHLGFVFQDFNLLDNFSLKDNIFLPLVLSGVDYRDMEKRLAPIASLLEIEKLLNKYPYEVSGGQKQRAAVARAIITNPELILADEPTGALDSKATDSLLRLFNRINEEGQTILMVTHSTIDYNLYGSSEDKLAVAKALDKHFEENSVKSDVSGFYEESRDANREQIYVLYGGLFFIGIFLGTMFLMVTVMIIFYKQISEGYDDKARYEIMEKVGMSNDEVKKSITSQVRMVFFLPIILAACHLAAAFPLLRRLLVMFNLTDVKLIVICMVATLFVFMVIYYIVFKITSRAYYRIVGNQI